MLPGEVDSGSGEGVGQAASPVVLADHEAGHRPAAVVALVPKTAARSSQDASLAGTMVSRSTGMGASPAVVMASAGPPEQIVDRLAEEVDMVDMAGVLAVQIDEDAPHVAGIAGRLGHDSVVPDVLLPDGMP